MHLDPQQADRAAGALLGAAAGDALGVPYEYGSRILVGEPQMLGGGLGGIAPGQWSDDTEMACAIALVSATGADLRTTEALDAVAEQFLRWYADGPPDVGIQTRQVLSRTVRGPGVAARMRLVADELHQAAWSALSTTADLRSALVAAVEGGGDTDTVAAITGALAGAAYGAGAIPSVWREALHGWPGLGGEHLVRLAVETAESGAGTAR